MSSIKAYFCILTKQSLSFDDYMKSIIRLTNDMTTYFTKHDFSNIHWMNWIDNPTTIVLQIDSKSSFDEICSSSFIKFIDKKTNIILFAPGIYHSFLKDFSLFSLHSDVFHNIKYLNKTPSSDFKFSDIKSKTKYIFVNASLQMSLPKILSQISHIIRTYCINHSHTFSVRQKFSLVFTDQDMFDDLIKFHNLTYFLDTGTTTEVPSGSLTIGIV